MSQLPTELYRADQVRELDRRAIERGGIDGYELMKRAGAAAFRRMRARWPQAHRVCVVCGVGNNGGDGYVIARLASEDGLDVAVMQLGDPGRTRGDALKAREAYLATGSPVDLFEGELPPVDVVVDAVFGTGLEREVEGSFARALAAVNGSEAGVMAVDIPSGLHSDTGCALGLAVKADLTVTFIGLKQGLLTGEAPDYCGKLVFEDLGVPGLTYEHVTPSGRRLDRDYVATVLPPRRRTAHKGDAGHVLVVGGDYGMAGAARMAGEAAARAGAGLISVATRESHAALMNIGRPELMCHGIEGPGPLMPLLERADAVALGPGLGRSNWGQWLLGAVLDTGLPVVVDADGLNLLSEAPRQARNWVLTPHPGEAARLLGLDTASVQRDRFAAVAMLQSRFAGVAVLKGAGTLVQSDEQLALCDAGNPGMASGGMGDVLTGVVAGLLAQGLEPRVAAEIGVWLHATAADRASAHGERGLLASDLMAYLRFAANP